MSVILMQMRRAAAGTMYLQRAASCAGRAFTTAAPARAASCTREQIAAALEGSGGVVFADPAIVHRPVRTHSVSAARVPRRHAHQPRPLPGRWGAFRRPPLYAPTARGVKGPASAPAPPRP